MNRLSMSAALLSVLIDAVVLSGLPIRAEISPFSPATIDCGRALRHAGQRGDAAVFLHHVGQTRPVVIP